MDFLKAALVTTIVAGSVAAIALASCQAVIPPGQFFNPQGITSIASYPTEAPPTLLTGAGNSLFYVEGTNIYSLSKAPGSSPVMVPITLSAPPKAMVYNGSTIVYCAAGVLGAFDPATLRPVVLSGLLPTGCLDLAITPTQLAYISWPDGGLASVVTVPLGDSGAAPVTIPLADGGGVDPTRATVGFVDNTTYYTWKGSVIVAGLTGLNGRNRPGGPCKVLFMGNPATPKMISFDAAAASGATTSIILRSDSADTLKRLGLENPTSPACCGGTVISDIACTRNPLKEVAPGGLGDFTVYGGFFYYSNNGEIWRLPTDLVTVDSGLPDAALVDIPGGAPIPSIVVDDSNVYFILGNSIYQAPLPAAN